MLTPPGESGDAEEGLRFMQAEYATEEAPILASRAKVAAFVEDVSRLRDDVERLAKRVDRL